MQRADCQPSRLEAMQHHAVGRAIAEVSLCAKVKETVQESVL
jgi:hypothetical protein